MTTAKIQTLADYVRAVDPGQTPERREQPTHADLLRQLHDAVDNLRRAERRYAADPSCRPSVTGAEIRLKDAMAAAKALLFPNTLSH
jgi:hypothetical protein